jgi:Protein of unknown function (DUF1275)
MSLSAQTPSSVGTLGPGSAPIPSVDSSPGAMLLAFVLAFVAGSVDVISFLGLDGLFTAHITGNLVVLAAHILARGEATLALVISVPLFIIILAATRVLSRARARGSPVAGRPSVRAIRATLRFSRNLRCCRSGRKRQCAEPDSRRDARRLSHGCAKRACADLARWRTVDRGADNKYYATHNRHRRDNSWTRPEPDRQSATARQAHLASSRRFSFWLCTRRMV